MHRVTTPTHRFACNVNPSEWDSFRITYKQKDRVILEKTEADLPSMSITEQDGRFILQYRLTQEETKLFEPGAASVQCRVHLPGGLVVATKRFRFDVDVVYNEEILP